MTLDYLTAVVGMPAVFCVTCAGLGLLVERAAGREVPGGLLIALGCCASVCASLLVYWLHLTAGPAVAVLVVLTLAGLFTGRARLRARLRPGWTAAAGLATYLLFASPEILSGGWTWSGYNFVNDTAVQFLLATNLEHHGTHVVGALDATAPVVVAAYLKTAYPLGTQAQLATLTHLLGSEVAIGYQGYLAALAATAAMALATVARALMRPWLAALAGFAAASAYLTYQYAQQGNIKELGVVACVATTIAVVSLGLAGKLDRRAALLFFALALAALIDVYNAAAIPFVGALLLWSGLLALLARRRLPNRGELGWLAGAGAATALLAMPALPNLAVSFNVLAGGFSGSAPAAQPLGQLARALPFTQVSGVWLAGDYRLPIVAEPANTLTIIATVIFLVLVPLGVLLAVRVRSAGAPLLIAAMGLVLALVATQVTPYAAAKLLAVTSPAFVLCSFAGAAGLIRWGTGRRRPLRALGLAGVAMVAGGVFVSDVLAYHHDNVAPTKRMFAIEDIAARLRGHGEILWNEWEEYAKYFARRAQVDMSSEAATPDQVQLRVPMAPEGRFFDLDQQLLSFVERFPLIVKRRSPAASRPPANYSFAYRNEFYEVWRRLPRPVVLRHLPEQLVYNAAQPVRCGAIRRLVAGAPPGSSLIAATYPATSGFDPRQAPHSLGWGIDPAHPEALLPTSPGFVAGAVPVKRAGVYDVWVQGDFSRPTNVSIDGRRIGAVHGVNTPNQWFEAGSVALAAGRHSARVVKPGGGFAPGDGADEYVGPLALVAHEPARLEPVARSRWRSLCGRMLDWVELVR